MSIDNRFGSLFLLLRVDDDGNNKGWDIITVNSHECADDRTFLLVLPPESNIVLVTGQLPKRTRLGSLFALLGELDPHLSPLTTHHQFVEWSLEKPVDAEVFLTDIREPCILLVVKQSEASNLSSLCTVTKRRALQIALTDINRYLCANKFQTLTEATDSPYSEFLPLQSNQLESGDPRIGSRAKPFSSPEQLLDFLYHDSPENYVFRGQVCEYPGPLLPSQMSGRFRVIRKGAAPPDWAGTTISHSEFRKAKALMNAREENEVLMLPPRMGSTHPPDTRFNDIPEAEFQSGFRIFFQQPYQTRHAILSGLLKDQTVEGLSTLLPADLGHLLSQHYGFSSLGLDATTDPEIAIFFATHNSPFYHVTEASREPGVVYRWPRQTAMICSDVLLPLEHGTFESCAHSLDEYVAHSPDIRLIAEEMFELPTGRQRFDVFIHVSGSRRELSALRFPKNAYERSRIGRQRAAILWPKIRSIEYVGGDKAVLVGDLMLTHQGEAFYFNQTGSAVSKSPDKFRLWPSLRNGMGNSSGDETGLCLSVVVEPYEFEDIYFEFMLRFASSCSYTAIHLIVDDAKNYDDRVAVGPLTGVIDIGYAMDAADGELLGQATVDPRMRRVGTPPPCPRFVPKELLDEFWKQYAGVPSR